MSVGDLLAWAWEEKGVAGTLEEMKTTLPESIWPSIDKQIQIRRARSEWLDLQVEKLLNLTIDSAESSG